MLRSSLGFHTLSLSMPLFKSETSHLIEDFKEYSRKMHNIQIYTKNEITYINFQSRSIGMSWLIRYDVWMKGFGLFVDIIEVTVNPKILGGIQDYLTAATYDDMEAAITNFNRISTAISPALLTFEHYSLKRVDYCINFSLNELAPGCSYEQVMSLIKRSDVPPHFDVWTEYDPVSHRRKSKPGSFYLVNGSVNINCYSKYMKYQDQSRKNVENGRPPVSQVTMDAAHDIIRFEIQCKYRKVYALSHKNKDPKGTTPKQYQQLLAHEVCIDKIDSYYKKTIGRGDWYTLQEAVRIIKSQHFNRQKEDRLINALKLVNDCRSVPKAKSAYQGNDLIAFKRTLADLTHLQINPVTIPKEWGIKRIPDLLNAYFDKVSEEKIKTDVEEFQRECFEGYFHT